MTKLAKSALLTAILTLALSAAAQTLTGTVTNGTTGKPAAGDEVILINLANGMDVGPSTKADAAGKFSFKITVPGPHLIRAVHQGVNYHQMAPPGVNTADLQVYDVAPKVTGLDVTADVIRFQADGGTMQGVRLFVVSNNSSPAKTQMNDHNFEFYLPAGAKVEQVQARAPNGQPIPAEAVPQSEKNRYALAFPLRPGETQFQVEFTLPYSGEIKVDPKPLYAAAHLVIVLPKTMQFTPATGANFQSMQDPNQGDSQVEVAQQTKPGQPLGFTLKGNGVITEGPGETASGAAQQEQQSQGRNGRPMPGGGLGAPIDAPDALQQYRWPILGGFAVLLAIGGWVVTKRQPAATV
ncbi:MAG: carboxypeptidase regulatory-like domain-containing protein, partial [Terriglobales bacterium]